MNIVVDGRTVTGRQGQTLAGVLLAAGVPSGLFCGIGVCFGCTATVDGVADVRTCQRPAVDGTVVETRGARDD